MNNPSFFFGTPIKDKPNLPPGFFFIERPDDFLFATDGKEIYFVTKEALFYRGLDGRLDKSKKIQLT